LLEEQELDAPQQRRRRDRDPYAESFRERHALRINAAKRWAKRILFVVLLYALYLLAIWWFFPWGETVDTPQGPRQAPEFSIAAANSFIPGLKMRLYGLGFTLFFAMMFLIVQFVALF
jgi:hypothetical protein